MPSETVCEEGELNPVKRVVADREERGNGSGVNGAEAGEGARRGDSATMVAESPTAIVAVVTIPHPQRKQTPR